MRDKRHSQALALVDTTMIFANASKAKKDMIEAYKECKDITPENRALIETFLKEEASKDYDISFDLFTIVGSE